MKWRTIIAVMLAVAIIGFVAVREPRTQPPDGTSPGLAVSPLAEAPAVAVSTSGPPALPTASPLKAEAPASSPPASSRADGATSIPTVMEIINNVPRSDPKKLGDAFLAEEIDVEWARRGETEIRRRLALDAELLAATVRQEVECRSQTCRIQVTYATHPEQFTDFTKLGSRASEFVRKTVDESGIGTGAIALHNGGEPGEMSGSDIFLIRGGFDQVVNAWKHPMAGR